MLTNINSNNEFYNIKNCQRDLTDTNSISVKSNKLTKEKSKYCYNFFKNECREKNCLDAHSEKELKIKFLQNFQFNYDFFIFHFKTEICPLIEFDHNRENCVYAHNNNELRRCYKPTIKPKLCDYWNHYKANESYEKTKCKKGKNCNFCHNLFEYNYHPLIYKTKKCENNCKNKLVCFKYHDELEKRIYNNEFKIYFKFTPKNFFTENNNNLEISFELLEKYEKYFKTKSKKISTKKEIKFHKNNNNKNYTLF